MLLLVLALTASLACTSSGNRAGSIASRTVQCGSPALALLFLDQLQAYPEYVQLGASGSFDRDQLGSVLRLEKVSFWSAPMVDSCTVLQSNKPFDNPDVDIFRKKNRLEVVVDDEDGAVKREYRWLGGLIVNIVSLEHTGEPALGIEEVDPDATTTRRILYFDGRRRALVFHRGAFPEPPGQEHAAQPTSGAPRVSST
jgi:hypothetical protein